jgi:hypothetical protein
MPLSDRKADATNYPLNKILKIRFALVVCFISIFSLNNSDNLKGRAKKYIWRLKTFENEENPNNHQISKIYSELQVLL